MNSYDCWLVCYANGRTVEVRPQRNVHEALFIANERSGLRMTQIVAVFRNEWCGNRQRKR